MQKQIPPDPSISIGYHATHIIFSCKDTHHHGTTNTTARTSRPSDSVFISSGFCCCCCMTSVVMVTNTLVVEERGCSCNEEKKQHPKSNRRGDLASSSQRIITVEDYRSADAGNGFELGHVRLFYLVDICRSHGFALTGLFVNLLLGFKM